MKWALGTVVLSLVTVIGISWSSLGSLCLCGETAPQPHRSPIDLALLSSERALTANHTADSVSLIDLQAGKVLAETKVGQKPSAIACAADGKRAAVSNLWAGSITLLAIDDARLTVAAEIPVGPLPRGLVFAPDGKTLYAALAGSDEVIALDWDSRKVTSRWPAPREPRDVALSADGKLLAASSTRSSTVRVWETDSGKLHWERLLIDAFNLRGLQFSPDGKELIVAHAFRREFPVSKNNIDSGWVIDNRLSKLPLVAPALPEYWQIGLDIRGQAVADLHGVGLSRDGKWLLATGSGTHELLILERNFIPWSPGEPGDFIDVLLEVGPHKLRRVELGGRPMTVKITPDDRHAIVANYLSDSVQVVELATGRLTATVALGGPKELSLARRGEALFYDGLKSHHQWFSCHTCHADGHTCGMKFDTLNDESYGNPKQTPSLYNVTRTAPYTWHGWQKELSAAIEKSMTETMFGAKPKPDEVQAMIAFLETLTPPPNPHRVNGQFSPAAQRGKTIFETRARCARCHKGELYTSDLNYDVKMEDDGSPFALWNPPTLVNVWNRGPYLHDGRAATLADVIERAHSSEKLSGQPLTVEEKKDLIEFLKSL